MQERRTSEQVAVLGAGSWGSCLAWMLGLNGAAVRLWLRDPQRAAEIEASRQNPGYLPGTALPETVHATADLPQALCGAALVVVAVPVAAMRETLERLPPEVPALLLAAKGLERGTGKRGSEVAVEVLGEAIRPRLAMLTGPNLATEIVRRQPTATVIAGENAALAERLQALFASSFFRVYTHTDVTGAELGGALKNPLAIAAGISDALGYGENAKAALLTRGLAEMTRLGVAAGAQASTFSGLAGLGDLLATAHSPHSRNYRLGTALGKGQTLVTALEQLGHVAEGAPTTSAAVLLAQRLGVEAPIMRALQSLLYEGATVSEAVTALLSRPSNREAW